HDVIINRGEGLNWFFCHGVTADVGKATVKYAVGAEAVDTKMRLFDQAALLLGCCELWKAASSKTGAGAYFAANNKKAAGFDAAIADEAIDVAVFVARSLRYVSWNTGGGGCPASYSTAAAGFGQTIRIEDAGLLLLALEQFLNINAPKNAQLGAAQKDMAFVAH